MTGFLKGARREGKWDRGHDREDKQRLGGSGIAKVFHS